MPWRGARGAREGHLLQRLRFAHHANAVGVEREEPGSYLRHGTKLQNWRGVLSVERERG